MLIDSHCHFDFNEFDHDRAVVLQRCRQLGIDHIVVPGVKAATWPALLSLCATDTALWPALGMHPLFMSAHQAQDITILDQLASTEHIVAIGEIGLDFYAKDHDKPSQLALFEQQLQLANSLDLPVILHVRKAHDVVIQRLKQHRLSGGIVHAFTGSEQQAKHYIELGFLLGVGAVISYPNAERLRQLFSRLPLMHLTFETDAPDMPPHGHHGERNSPESVHIYHQILSTYRSETAEEIARQTSLNVRRVLAI